jgi:hypothetical protein
MWMVCEYRQIQRDRTAMTGLVGEAPEGKQLLTSDVVIPCAPSQLSAVFNTGRKVPTRRR